MLPRTRRRLRTVPRRVGSVHGKAAESLDFSQPKRPTPVAGYVPNKSYDLVRNPRDPRQRATPCGRRTLTRSAPSSAARTRSWTRRWANEADFVLDPARNSTRSSSRSSRPRRTCEPDPSTRPRATTTIDLGVPPFDDIHVRKVNSHRQGCWRRIGGGPDTGSLAGFPAGQPDQWRAQDLRPLRDAGRKGRRRPGGLDQAKAEMKQAPSTTRTATGLRRGCLQERLDRRQQPAEGAEQALLIQQNLQAIGITLNIVLHAERRIRQDLRPENHIAFTTGWAGWLKDYPDVHCFFQPGDVRAEHPRPVQPYSWSSHAGADEKRYPSRPWRYGRADQKASADRQRPHHPLGDVTRIPLWRASSRSSPCCSATRCTSSDRIVTDDLLLLQRRALAVADGVGRRAARRKRTNQERTTTIGRSHSGRLLARGGERGRWAAI